ncbi:MAG: AbrB family transcriptional regulator [Thiolinea sp.]
MRLKKWPEPFTAFTAAAPVILTLILGYAGAMLGRWVHLPVPALLGSAIFLSLLSFSPLPLRIPDLLRNIGFTILGCSMGSGISREMLALLGNWPLSLFGLTVTVIVMMLLCSALLRHFFAMSPTTALLASTPGGLSMVVALGEARGADLRAVLVLQSVRLILVMAVLPLVITGLDAHVVTAFAPPVTLEPVWILLLPLLAFVLGNVLEWLRVPAAYLLAGLILSGSGHVGEVLHGNLPTQLINFGFVVIGCLVGSRLKGLRWPELKHFALAAVLSVTLSSLISALAAVLVAYWLALPFGQVWVAYSPGGIEAMAALALALRYDPAYTAAHHLFRIIGLTLILPWFVGRVYGRAGGEGQEEV